MDNSAIEAQRVFETSLKPRDALFLGDILHKSYVSNCQFNNADGAFFDARFPAFFPAPIDPVDRLGSTAPAFPSIARPAHPSAAQPRFRLLPRRLVDPVHELIGTNRLLKDRKRDFVLF